MKLLAIRRYITADLLGMGMNFMDGHGVKDDGNGVGWGNFYGDGMRLMPSTMCHSLATRSNLVVLRQTVYA